MHKAQIDDFKSWRDAARNMLAANIAPHDVMWNDSKAAQAGLFAGDDNIAKSAQASKVPKDFLQLAEKIACHSDNEKWHILYSALWRITHGEKHLLRLSADDLVRRLHIMEKQIRFDAHKTKAFVRFRKIEDEQGEFYVAWHNPDHKVLKLVAPFFARRFADMRWTIFTNRESASWDGEELNYGDGIPASMAPAPDKLEEMWRAYYRATFNPARIKIKAMKKEMPVRHWKTLPEAEIIAELLQEAPARVEKMIESARKNLG